MSAPPIRHRGLSEITADENVNNARRIIKRWEVDCGNLGSYSSLFLTDTKEAHKLLEATLSLQHAMNYYVKLSTTSEKLVESQGLMQIAMNRIKFEFYTILYANRGSLGSDSFSGNTARSERAMEDLRSVSECMIACGYGKECVGIYRIVRKSIIDETLYRLGIERLSYAELKKMEWTILEKKINVWLRSVKIAVQTLFYREKVICDAVFSSRAKIAEACFAGISSDAAADLFAFAENVCRCKKALSPEKIFRLLDLYEAISNLWPDSQFIFPDKLSAAVRSTQTKLAEKVRAMLGQFEEAIRKDSSRAPPGGGVHPLTRYVMNFLVFLGDYSAAVSDIVKEGCPVPLKYRLSGGEAGASTAEISRLLAWLTLVLLCKLDSKAAAYKEGALSYLFMANNLNYVVSKARSSNLMGQEWVRKHELKAKTYLANYEKFTVSFQEACRGSVRGSCPTRKSGKM